MSRYNVISKSKKRRKNETSDEKSLCCTIGADHKWAADISTKIPVSVGRPAVPTITMDGEAVEDAYDSSYFENIIVVNIE